MSESDSFLGDSVDTTSASLYTCSCTTGAVFSELRDQLAILESDMRN